MFDVLWEERQVWVFTLTALMQMQNETVLLQVALLLLRRLNGVNGISIMFHFVLIS